MTIKFFGLLTHEHSSETIPKQPGGPVMDIDYMVKQAQAHEAAGFDRILVAHHSSNPDGILLASHLAQKTEKLKFMIAHRPGFIAPAYAARMWATFDNLYPGRAGIHVISGGNDAEQRADGDFLDHDARYTRTAEWLEVFRKTLTAPTPFDHEGSFFRYSKAYSRIKALQQPYPPVFFGGASDAAVAIGAKHADIWALYGEPLDDTRQMISRIRNAATLAGRDPASINFVVSFRPVVGNTEADAWRKADQIIERIKELRGEAFGTTKGAKPDAVSSQRLRDIAAQGKVRDKRLWTEVAAAVGGGSSTTGLVGTPEQIADSLRDYHKLGISNFLIRGFDPAADIQEFGQGLIPAVHELLSRDEKAAVGA